MRALLAVLLAARCWSLALEVDNRVDDGPWNARGEISVPGSPNTPAPAPAASVDVSSARVYSVRARADPSHPWAITSVPVALLGRGGHQLNVVMEGDTVSALDIVSSASGSR